MLYLLMYKQKRRKKLIRKQSLFLFYIVRLKRPTAFNLIPQGASFSLLANQKPNWV